MYFYLLMNKILLLLSLLLLIIIIIVTFEISAPLLLSYEFRAGAKAIQLSMNIALVRTQLACACVTGVWRGRTQPFVKICKKMCMFSIWLRDDLLEHMVRTILKRSWILVVVLKSPWIQIRSLILYGGWHEVAINVATVWSNIFSHSLWKYRKIPKISPSKYKPPKPVT